MLSKIPSALLAFALVASSVSADEKIDQILAELTSLRQQVASLEARLALVESQSAETAAAQLSSPDSNTPRDRRNWFENMRVELKKAETRDSGAWTSPSTWTQVETGMKREDVVALLGEPTSYQFSVRKDTDEILYYRGDLDGSGENAEGEIRIYKNKVRRFTVPDFPSE